MLSFIFSPSGGFQESHTFSFASCYPAGISCFMYHPSHDILIVCGQSYKLSELSESNEASQMGMSLWRLISGPPYYKLTLTVAEQMVLFSFFHLLKKFTNMIILHSFLRKNILFYKM